MATLHLSLSFLLKSDKELHLKIKKIGKVIPMSCFSIIKKKRVSYRILVPPPLHPTK